MTSILKKEKLGNRRIFYLFGRKIFSYHKKIAVGGDYLNEVKAKLNHLE